LYAIVDIETTGGKFNEEGVTEIAIYRYDGHQIVDQFISLINPEIPIQPFVVNLTGINKKMLRNAPKFYEVAKRIIEITEECTIVAHNASFDYRILKLEFERLGYDYKRKTLDTVELSKNLIPGLESYSLGKLCKSLGIPVTDRHRASGDALATVKLFKILLEKDLKKDIIKKSVVVEKKTELTPRLIQLMRDLPNSTGVYYMHREDGDIIYIGKSKNIKKRINQHFLNKSSRAQRMINELEAISYEETGSELVALLKESEEIKSNLPKYNRAQRKSKFIYSLDYFTNKEGYIELKIRKVDENTKGITSFANLGEAKKVLENFIEEYNLCQKLCNTYKSKNSCFNHGVGLCNGACIGEESPEIYNGRVQKLIDKYSFKNQDFAIIDKGRNPNEKSVILIEDGIYRGYAFIDLDNQINNIDILRNLITPMIHNKEVKNIIQSYLRRKKGFRIINLKRPI
jgi:DNA polymerase-3 subunit epsilon